MDFVTATSSDNWFKEHPEKIAGVEYESTSYFFPVQVRGTMEDVRRVTGMDAVDPKPASPAPIRKLALAKAKAKALKLKLTLK